MEEAREESGQQFRLFPNVLHNVCPGRENILFENRIKGLDFDFCCEKLKICLNNIYDTFQQTSWKGGKVQIPFITQIISLIFLTDRIGNASDDSRRDLSAPRHHKDNAAWAEWLHTRRSMSILIASMTSFTYGILGHKNIACNCRSINIFMADLTTLDSITMLLTSLRTPRGLLQRNVPRSYSPGGQCECFSVKYKYGDGTSL